MAKTKTITSKGYKGEYRWVDGENSYHGKLVGIDDLVTFGGETRIDVVLSFDEAVTDYKKLLDEVDKIGKPSN